MGETRIFVSTQSPPSPRSPCGCRLAKARVLTMAAQQPAWAMLTAMACSMLFRGRPDSATGRRTEAKRTCTSAPARICIVARVDTPG